ncbi:MAG: type II toxin-antitoxin system VapC family toxin [Acidobacteria bacterium]|nr:type II toxin-antitoxin system VapC family toxin [Acidobacteriota bacterium]
MILLDTHVLVWLLSDDRRLGKQTRQVIDRSWAKGEAAVSAITFWEVAMLHDKGRLALLTDIGSWRLSLLEEGLVEIAVDGEIGIRATLLPNLHSDPADRLIIATALKGHQLATADRRLLKWPGRLSRLRATQ